MNEVSSALLWCCTKFTGLQTWHLHSTYVVFVNCFEISSKKIHINKLTELGQLTSIQSAMISLENFIRNTFSSFSLWQTNLYFTSSSHTPLLSNSCKTRRNTAKDEQKYQQTFLQCHVWQSLRCTINTQRLN